MYCSNCTLLQLSHIAPQEIMYKKFYWYKSGITKTMRDGLNELYHDIKKNCEIKPGDVIYDPVRSYPQRIIRLLLFLSWAARALMWYNVRSLCSLRSTH